MFDNFTATYHRSEKGFPDYDSIMAEKKLSLKGGLVFKGEEAYKFMSSVLSLDKKNADLCMKGIDEVSEIKLSFSIGENYFSPECLEMGSLEFGDVKNVSDFIYALVNRTRYDSSTKDIYPVFDLSQDEQIDIQRELLLIKKDEQAFLNMYPEYMQKSVNFFTYIVSSELADYLLSNSYETGIPLYDVITIWDGIESGTVKSSNIRDSLFPKFISDSYQSNYGEYIIIAGLPAVNINNSDNMVIFTTVGPDDFLEKLDWHIRKDHLKIKDSCFAMSQCISDEYLQAFEDNNLKMECIPLSDNPYKNTDKPNIHYGLSAFTAMHEIIKNDMKSLRGQLNYEIDTRMFSRTSSIQTYIPKTKERIIISYSYNNNQYVLTDLVHSPLDGTVAAKPLGNYFISDNPDINNKIFIMAEIMWKYKKLSYSDDINDIIKGFFYKEAYDYNNGTEKFFLDTSEEALAKLKTIRIDKHGHLNYEKKYVLSNYYRMIAVLKGGNETDIDKINRIIIREMVSDKVKESYMMPLLKFIAEKLNLSFNEKLVQNDIAECISVHKKNIKAARNKFISNIANKQER